jgi:thiol-disulfide isomerase/thioredoxin
MIRTAIIIFLLLIVFSCSKSNKATTFELNGTIKGEAPDYIYLNYGKQRDSAIVKNNRFLFKGNISNPIEASFTIPPASAMVQDWFYLENSNINIRIILESKKIKEHKINFITIDTITGTRTSIIRSEFEKFEKSNKNKSNWNSLLFKKIDEIIEQNPSNNYSGFLLNNAVGKLNKKQIQVLFKKIDTSALTTNNLESLKRNIYPELTVKLGNKMFDFDLPNPKNEIVSTRKYRGKVLYIDFWASWCVPCRKLNPELIKIYNKYNREDFEILGVSIDKDIEKWKKAIAKDNLIWDNVIESYGFQGEISSKYNVTAIPKNFIINREGIIVREDVSTSELELIITELIDK